MADGMPCCRPLLQVLETLDNPYGVIFETGCQCRYLTPVTFLFPGGLAQV